LKHSTSFSRRRFLTVSTVGVAGVWFRCSSQAAPKAVRKLVSEARRSVLKPRFTPNPQSWDPHAITAAWLGHSTVLLNFYGVTILTDPVLFKCIGLNTLLGTIGPKRLVAPALRAGQLPPIDLVLLSHAHMDHLDPATLCSLPGSPRAVTAHKTLDLLRNTGLKEPQALAWGDKTRISTRHGEVEIRAFEVKHWGARWRFDKYRGFNGYTIAREDKKILFGGDTAWIESFRGLRKEGRIDLAIMPIGAYQPWICSHCTPEQAARMANDAQAEYLLPIHFKTFPFGTEGVVEPMQRLRKAIEPERIGWGEVGETFRLS
jgi:L-ascorbate metabolism protein UlaG (beta-lactamase superfamily)